jgi:Zn-dependent peptidase ImmA (M78 family)/O-acetyl-ADP-ribose deacetylase (regulator of RNase III)
MSIRETIIPQSEPGVDSPGVELSSFSPKHTRKTMEYAWTHSSIRKFAGQGDPIEKMMAHARSVVLRAKDKGWSGPPYDPFQLAEILGIIIVPKQDIGDARLVPVKNDRLQIEFNPDRPKGRISFSVAHELAHSFFPDCQEQARHRLAATDMAADDWQLEMLCNIGASEILMPVGSLPELKGETLAIERLMELRKQYDVSAEALLLRVVRLTDEPCAMFAASRRTPAGQSNKYSVDYALPSRAFRWSIGRGLMLPVESAVAECTAIGYTAKGDEDWLKGGLRLHIEGVGIPPYPGHSYPRVVGIAVAGKSARKNIASITYLKGDATEPRGKDHRLIAHVVNNKTPRWGGGFALVVRKKWPQVQQDFLRWAEGSSENLKLGNVHFTGLHENLRICHMVSQHGYGESASPRIRYWALENCLNALADEALETKASVHMPRIGAGQAGGSWQIISEMVETALCDRGIEVTVYDLPGTELKQEPQKLLFK